jgi:hypothetical protein
MTCAGGIECRIASTRVRNSVSETPTLVHVVLASLGVVAVSVLWIVPLMDAFG